MGEPKMFWNDKELKSMGDVMEAAYSCKTKEQALKFMEYYRTITPHADQNIGYMTGYYSPSEMRRLQELFEVAHPVFGTCTPTPEKAFWEGKQMARAQK